MPLETRTKVPAAATAGASAIHDDGGSKAAKLSWTRARLHTCLQRTIRRPYRLWAEMMPVFLPYADMLSPRLGAASECGDFCCARSYLLRALRVIRSVLSSVCFSSFVSASKSSISTATRRSARPARASKTKTIKKKKSHIYIYTLYMAKQVPIHPSIKCDAYCSLWMIGTGTPDSSSVRNRNRSCAPVIRKLGFTSAAGLRPVMSGCNK